MHRGIRLAVIGLAAAAALAGGGCATVREARRVQRGADRAPGERTATAAEMGLTSNRTVSLDEAVPLALAHHPSVAQARQGLAAATAQLAQARSAHWPGVGASARYSRSTANAAGGPSSGDTQGSMGGSLSLDWVLYDFGKTPAVVRQSALRLAAAEQSLRSARNDAAYAVRSAFFGLGKAIELRQVADDAVRQYRARAEQVRAFAEVGARTRYDVLKAEVDLGNAELGSINARNEVSNARAGLNRALGLAEDPGYAIRAARMAEYAADEKDLGAAALRNHPNLRWLRFQEQAAFAAVDAAVADRYPSLGLQAQWSAAGSEWPLVWNAAAALQAAAQLFSAGEKNGRIDQAVAELRAARARVADAEQQVHLELSNAINALDGARRRTGLTELIARQAGENLSLVNERYRLGSASSVELTDAQAALTGAQAEHVRARFDYQTAAARIRHAIGEDP